MDAWDRLMAAPRVTAARPALAGDIAAFEKRAGLVVHPSLKAAWLRADGVEVSRGLELLSLREAERYLGAFEGLAVVPFTDSSDSDPFCLACDPLLDGRVVRIFHDRSPSSLVAFRSLDGFVDAVVAQLAAGDLDVDELPLDYDARSARTPDDVAVGRRLAHAAREAIGDGKAEAWAAVRTAEWACSLLSDPADIAAILGWPEEYARDAAEARLQELGEQAADALRSYEQALQAFEQRCVELLKARGYQVRVSRTQERPDILVEGAGLNTAMMFNLKDEAELVAALVRVAEMGRKRR